MKVNPFWAISLVTDSRRIERAHTGKLLGLVCWDSPEVLQITLVSDKGNDNVLIRVIPQLLQPSCDVLVCLVLGNVVDQ